MNQRHTKRKTNRRVSRKPTHEGFVDTVKDKIEKGVGDIKQAVKRGVSSMRSRERRHA